MGSNQYDSPDMRLPPDIDAKLTIALAPGSRLVSTITEPKRLFVRLGGKVSR